MTEFEIGETVIIKLDVQEDDTFVNPDAGYPKVKIEKSGTEVLPFTEMTQDEVGKFHYDYDPSEVGKYKTVFKAVNSGRTSIKKDYFVVEET